MQLHIDNSSYSRANILFGRVLPALAAICAVWSLASILSSDGIASGTTIPAMLSVLWIVFMVVVYVRRGRHPAVQSIEFSPNRINVHFHGRDTSHDITQIRDMEYEGVRNRTRVKVLNAPFPKDGERILVITLSDDTELRVRVGYEHHAPLQEIATQIK